MTDHANPSVPVTGGSMPLLGFGTWQIPDADAPAAVGAALEAGYRHIDTATGYSNQRGVGKALADSGLARDDVFVTTKLPPDNADRVRQTIEESLEQLGSTTWTCGSCTGRRTARPDPTCGSRSSRRGPTG